MDISATEHLWRLLRTSTNISRSTNNSRHPESRSQSLQEGGRKKRERARDVLCGSRKSFFFSGRSPQGISGGRLHSWRFLPPPHIAVAVRRKFRAATTPRAVETRLPDPDLLQPGTLCHHSPCGKPGRSGISWGLSCIPGPRGRPPSLPLHLSYLCLFLK